MKDLKNGSNLPDRMEAIVRKEWNEYHTDVINRVFELEHYGKINQGMRSNTSNPSNVR